MRRRASIAEIMASEQRHADQERRYANRRLCRLIHSWCDADRRKPEKLSHLYIWQAQKAIWDEMQ